MICACKLGIDSHREPNYLEILPKRSEKFKSSDKAANLCVTNFKREYLYQLKLIADLCQLYKLSPSECVENWILFFQKQQSAIFNYGTLTFWQSTMKQQQLTYEALPQIGKQLFLIDCLKTCLPMHWVRLSFNSVNSEYKNGAFNDVILTQRQQLVIFAKQLSPEVMNHYEEIWNTPYVYLSRGTEQIAQIVEKFKLYTLFHIAGHETRDLTKQAEEKNRLTIEFCLQLALRKKAMEKLIAGIDSCYGLSLGKVLSDDWQYDILTTEF